MSSDSPDRSSYRSEFGDADSVKRYQATEFGPHTWSTLLWGLEQVALAKLLDSRSFVPRRERYLDFACGTGRVTSFVAPHFESTVGVDISQAMIDAAAQRLPSARFVRADVTTQPEAAGDSFDLVTSFRFVLNADPDDRLPALRWLRSRLRDESSRAIVNNHSNLWTHKALPFAIRHLRSPGRTTTGNVLSHRAMTRLVREAGFSIESIHGMGHLGGRALRGISYPTMRRIQMALSEIPLIERLGEDQLYVLSPS